MGGIGQLSRILGSGTSQDIFIQAQGTSNNLGLNSVNGYLYFQTGSTERARIDSSGNLLVGGTDSNPLSNGGTYKNLVVTGGSGYAVFDGISTATASGSAIASFAGGTTGASSGKFAAGINVELDGTSTTNAVGRLVFYTASAGSAIERARIDSSGNLLVGTTTSGSNGITIKPTNDSTQAITMVSAATSGGAGFNMYSSGVSNYRFYVTWAGTIFATNTTISAISDQRFKENIQDLDVGLNAVMALKPRKFDWKAGKGKDIKGDRGFIAQEIQQVFPDLIDEWKDPAPEGEEPYKSVRQDLIPVLVKAIQELKAENDVLKARLDAAGL